MATYQTFQEVGLKENISDIITNISPRKTPFLSSIGTEKIHQPLFQWQEDSLRSVNGTSAAAVEGADPSDITVTPTVMRNNQTQIFVEAVKVSETTQASLAYGRAKELAYQMSKTSAALKRDLENAFVGTAQVLNAGSSSTARNMAGAQQQVASGNINYMGAATNLSEAGLLIALQNAFTAGADPDRIQVTPSNSIVVAAFASAAGRYRTFTDPKSNNIVNAVNLYVSPFGEQKVEINRFIKAKNTLIYEPAMWSQATLRPWTRTTLAKSGDAEKQMIVGEFSLKHKNYAASAMVIDNATTGF
jgi:hypothetical protein